AKALARMDGDVEILSLDELEGIKVPCRRETSLGASDIEADHALVAVAHRKLCGLNGAGRLPHGRYEQLHHNPPPLHPRSLLAFAKTVENRRHHLVERQPTLCGELWRIPHFGVHNVVDRKILGALGPHTLDRIPRLDESD